MAAPMPLDAPVTTATLPVSLLIVLSFLRADLLQVMRGVNSCLATWTVMLTVVSDLNTSTSNGNAMFFVIPKKQQYLMTDPNGAKLREV